MPLDQCELEPELVAGLKALADPTRLAILDLLMEGVQCNCEIAERLDLSLSLISHHMRVLRLVGLVESQRDPQDERWIYFSINKEELQRLNNVIWQFLDASRIQPRQSCCGPKRCGADDIPCEPSVEACSASRLSQV